MLWYQGPAARAAKNVTLMKKSNVFRLISSHIYLFPTTGSSEVSGNAGLLDQLAALKWVQQNIASFGGDANSVSIGADRSGADVVSIHLLTDTADMDLFRRALLMVSFKFILKACCYTSKDDVERRCCFYFIHTLAALI